MRPDEYLARIDELLADLERELERAKARTGELHRAVQDAKAGEPANERNDTAR